MKRLDSKEKMIDYLEETTENSPPEGLGLTPLRKDWPALILWPLKIQQKRLVCSDFSGLSKMHSKRHAFVCVLLSIPNFETRI